VLEELAKEQTSVVFLKIDAESLSTISEQYSVTSIPTTIVLRDGRAADVLEGARAPELVALVARHVKAAAAAAPTTPATGLAKVQSSGSSPTTESKEQLFARLAKLIASSPVMAFIKGTPSQPKCGFTRQLLELLNKVNVRYSTFDILTDENVRSGLKEYSKWPTYPQLYVNNKLIGGLDVVKELQEEGQLVSTFPPDCIQGATGATGTTANASADLTSRLRALISRHRIMLFMKGTPAAPQCGFSSRAVALIRTGLGLSATDPITGKFDTFDILTDAAVRQGLKDYSKWPTYPQLYVDGKLIGGVDIMVDLNDEGELATLLGGSATRTGSSTTASMATSTPTATAPN